MRATSQLPAVVLAHQGGWDEALLVLGPIVVIVIALAVVKRRVDKMGPQEPHQGD